MLSYYLTIEGPEEADANLFAYFSRNIQEAVTALHGVVGVRVFQPATGDVAVFNDQGTPRLLLQLLLTSATGLENALADGIMTGIYNISVNGARATHQMFELVEEPLPATGALSYANARLSLAVRYYASTKAEKVDAFQRAYLDGHPAALRNFPEIRRIFCYIPVTWNDPTDIPPSNAIIGNEVVFDSLEDLNRALHSSAMDAVKQHSKTMPVFDGSNTHYPMKLAYEWIRKNR